MNITFAASLHLDQVIKRVGAGRNWTEGSGPWTRRSLIEADAQFAGAWRDVELPRRQLALVELPHHTGEPCRGDRAELVPVEGNTVAGTTNRLREGVAVYQAANPSCWSRIEQAGPEPFSPVVLATAPAPGIGFRASGSTDSLPRLYVLDGLHRLVGWCLAGRLDADLPLYAIVGGPVTEWKKFAGSISR